MKKALITIGIVFLSLFIASCSQNPQDTSFRLQTPTNLKVDRNILTFNAVENASGYMLSINSINHKTTETSYTFEEDGDYVVRIQALSGDDTYQDSLFSDALVFKVRFLKYPEDIQILNNQVYFEQDQDAQSYDVEINGEVYNTLEDLPPYLEPGVYDIRVKARSDIYNESEYSPMVTIKLDENSRIRSEHQYFYSIHSSFELPIYTYPYPGLNYIKVHQTDGFKENYQVLETLTQRMDYYAAQNTIYFSTTYMNYMKSLFKEDEFQRQVVLTFEVQTNLGDHYITIRVNQLETPYSYNGNVQKSNFNDDVTFKFETFDYEFVGIKGYLISDDDYTYKDGILTMSANFINKVYSQSRNSLQLEFVALFKHEKEKENYEYPIFIAK